MIQKSVVGWKKKFKIIYWKKEFLRLMQLIFQILGLFSYNIHLSSFYKYLNKKYFVVQFIILFNEMIPTSVLGLTFSAEKLIPKMKNKYIKHIIIQISFFYFLCKLIYLNSWRIFISSSWNECLWSYKYFYYFLFISIWIYTTKKNNRCYKTCF